MSVLKPEGTKGVMKCSNLKRNVSVWMHIRTTSHTNPASLDFNLETSVNYYESERKVRKRQCEKKQEALWRDYSLDNLSHAIPTNS